MVAYLFCGDSRLCCPRPQRKLWLGAPVLWTQLPRDPSPRRLRRIGRGLARLGTRRVILSQELPEETTRWLTLPGVDPLPLCRAKGAELALALLDAVPPRLRRVALVGENAREGYRMAQALCPRVGTLLLDFDRGEEPLRQALEACYGAVCLHLDQAPPPQVTVELSRREGSQGRVLRLWGEPGLGGLALALDRPLPPGVPALPLLELLWETGRVELEQIRITQNAAPPPS